jgi:hypothetical protein
MGRIDHQRVRAATLIRQPEEHFCDDAFLAPPFPTAENCLVRPIFLRGIAPSQAIAINEDNATQNPPVVNTGLATGLREKGFKLGQLRVA